MKLGTMALLLLLPALAIAQSDKTIKDPQDTPTPIQGDIQKPADKPEFQQKLAPDYEKMFTESQRNLDRSINTLNGVATLMGVLVTLVTLIIAIGAGAGFLQGRTLRTYIRKIREDSKVIEELRKKHECDFEDMKATFNGLPNRDNPVLNKAEMAKFEIQVRRIEILDAFGMPIKAESYFLWGTYLFLTGNYDASIEILDKGLSKKAEAMPFSVKMLALKELKRYQDGLATANKEVELFPASSRAWYDKACMHSLLKEKEAALESLGKAISIDPKHKPEARRDEDLGFIQEEKRFNEITKE